MIIELWYLQQFGAVGAYQDNIDVGVEKLVHVEVSTHNVGLRRYTLFLGHVSP